MDGLHPHPGERPPLPAEPRECKARAEDESRPDGDRLVWALLAVAGELTAVRQALSRKGR